jgi:hypothetical protein
MILFRLYQGITREEERVSSKRRRIKAINPRTVQGRVACNGQV